MVHYRYPSGGRVRRKNRRNQILTAALVAISMSPVAFFADFQGHYAAPAVEIASNTAPQPPKNDTAPPAPPRIYDRTLVDPKPTLSPEALTFAQNAPLTTTFTPLSVQNVAQAEPSAVPMEPEPVTPSPEVTIAEAVPPIPLPVPRPTEFRFQKPAEAPQSARRIARAPASRPVQSAALPSPPAKDPSFFEKLFGIRPASPPEAALSYAALDRDSAGLGTRPHSAPYAVGAGTAVYDISAKVVILPNGERLEAHSGFGDKMDDPRYVNVRMKGATPPGTYIITEREALFHGVRALRLTPVGGSRAIYGRDGILAHTYMLGPRGDSNGCVSFKNYDRFLQAYLRGEVKRLVVTAGSKQDLLPRIVNNGPRRTARDT